MGSSDENEKLVYEMMQVFRSLFNISNHYILSLIFCLDYFSTKFKFPVPNFFFFKTLRLTRKRTQSKLF